MLFPSEYITYQNASHKVIHVNLSDSTNLLLDQLIREGKIEDGLVVRTDYQSAGKGMMNNAWESNPKMNLLFSLFHETNNFKISNQFYISKLVSIALSRAVDKFIGEKRCKVKWPNDAFIQEKKIAGILIQNSIRDHEIQNCIIGIGINVNQLQFQTTSRATSLKLLARNSIEIDDVLGAFLSEWDQYSKLLYPLNKEKIDAFYFDLLYGYQEWLLYKSNGHSFEGKIVGVKENGHLIIETRGGKEKIFDLKEISLIQA